MLDHLLGQGKIMFGNTFGELLGRLSGHCGGAVSLD
jgi:hypothetical protein